MTYPNRGGTPLELKPPSNHPTIRTLLMMPTTPLGSASIVSTTPPMASPTLRPSPDPFKGMLRGTKMPLLNNMMNSFKDTTLLSKKVPANSPFDATRGRINPLQIPLDISVRYWLSHMKVGVLLSL
jgi:hypothetical protein